MKYLPLFALLLLCGCGPTTETVVEGDRRVEQVMAGRLRDNREFRPFFILRDTDTQCDYLVVIDAGIIKLESKKVEQ